jgi:hypothetical protein
VIWPRSKSTSDHWSPRASPRRSPLEKNENGSESRLVFASGAEQSLNLRPSPILNLLDLGVTRSGHSSNEFNVSNGMDSSSPYRRRCARMAGIRQPFRR